MGQVENEILKEESKMMTEKFRSISNKENELVETNEVERMAVNALKKYLKGVDQDCKMLVMEGNSKI